MSVTVNESHKISLSGQLGVVQSFSIDSQRPVTMIRPLGSAGVGTSVPGPILTTVKISRLILNSKRLSAMLGLKKDTMTGEMLDFSKCSLEIEMPYFTLTGKNVYLKGYKNAYVTGNISICEDLEFLVSDIEVKHQIDTMTGKPI